MISVLDIPGFAERTLARGFCISFNKGVETLLSSAFTGLVLFEEKRLSFGRNA
jgi:hypothetical protein